jgi:galactokinase
MATTVAVNHGQKSDIVLSYSFLPPLNSRNYLFQLAPLLNFQDIFHMSAIAQAIAPGRVNLLGEHTDYNDGYVLPIAIPQQTTVQLSFSLNEQHHFYSEAFAERVNLTSTDPVPQGFASYLYGCIRILEQQGISIPPLNVYVTSSIPIGAGLSSSAALEVAMLRGLRSLLSLTLDDIQIAQLGQQAERQYSGVQCGIMDQMAASLGDSEHLLFLDTRTLAYQRLPLPIGAEIIVIDSGIPRTLAGSGYNQRRSECEAAAKMLGVKALRDIPNVEVIAHLPSPFKQRSRHVITENNRVLTARQDITAEQFGALMNASHASLRDDYQVSVAGLDILVSILQNTEGVFGAKLTGAGFGGSCVALVETQKGKEIAVQVVQAYNQAGNHGRILLA